MLSTLQLPSAKRGPDPYTFEKSKVHAKKYEKEKLREIARRLLIAYHDAHRGVGDLALALELEILAL